jgi:hypothetical protein
MSTAFHPNWMLDLNATSDEVLLLFAREAKLRVAAEELTCRCWQKLKARLPALVARDPLSHWDLEDALQQAYFWIQEAIARYDSGQLRLPHGSSFATFLHRTRTVFKRSASRVSFSARLVTESCASSPVETVCPSMLPTSCVAPA